MNTLWIYRIKECLDTIDRLKSRGEASGVLVGPLLFGATPLLKRETSGLDLSETVGSLCGLPAVLWEGSEVSQTGFRVVSPEEWERMLREGRIEWAPVVSIFD